jgi:phosphate starvation-inducible PhoH-like protein
LKGIEKILGGVEDIAFCRFGDVDVVRHSLVAKIVEAYARAEEGTA